MSYSSALLCRRSSSTSRKPRVVIGDVDEDGARARLEEASSDRLEHRRLDVRDRGSIEAAFAGPERLDLLVNSAGVTTHAPLEELAWEDWTRVLDIDLNGAF